MTAIREQVGAVVFSILMLVSMAGGSIAFGGLGAATESAANPSTTTNTIQLSDTSDSSANSIQTGNTSKIFNGQAIRRSRPNPDRFHTRVGVPLNGSPTDVRRAPTIRSVNSTFTSSHSDSDHSDPETTQTERTRKQDQDRNTSRETTDEQPPSDETGTTSVTTASVTSTSESSENEITAEPGRVRLTNESKQISLFIGVTNTTGKIPDGVSGVPLSIEVTAPNGTARTYSLTTEASGSATLDLPVRLNGTYDLRVTSAQVSDSDYDEFIVGPKIAFFPGWHDTVEIGREVTVGVGMFTAGTPLQNEQQTVNITTPSGSELTKSFTTDQGGTATFSFTPQETGEYSIYGENVERSLSLQAGDITGKVQFNGPFADNIKAGQTAGVYGQLKNDQQPYANQDIDVAIVNRDTDTTVHSETTTTNSYGQFGIQWQTPTNNTDDYEIDVSVADGSSVAVHGTGIDSQTVGETSADPSPAVDIRTNFRNEDWDTELAPGEQATADIRVTENGTAVSGVPIQYRGSIGWPGAFLTSGSATTNATGYATITFTVPQSMPQTDDFEFTVYSTVDGTTYEETTYGEITSVALSQDNDYSTAPGTSLNYSVEATNTSSESGVENVSTQVFLEGTAFHASVIAADTVVTGPDGTGQTQFTTPSRTGELFFGDWGPYRSANFFSSADSESYDVSVHANDQYDAGERVTLSYTASTSANVSANILVAAGDDDIMSVEDGLLHSNRVASGENITFRIPTSAPAAVDYEITVSASTPNGERTVIRDQFSIDESSGNVAAGMPTYDGNAVHYVTQSNSGTPVVEIPFDGDVDSASVTRENFTLLDGGDNTSAISKFSRRKSTVVLELDRVYSSDELQVSLSESITDDNGNPITNPGNKSVVFAGQTLEFEADADGGGRDVQYNLATNITAFQGIRLAINTSKFSTTGDATPVVIEGEDNNFFFEGNTGVNSSVFTFDTSDRELGTYRIFVNNSDDPRNRAFINLRDLQLGVSVADLDISDDDTISTTVSAVASAREVTVELVDSNDNVINSTSVALNGQGEATVQFDASTADGGGPLTPGLYTVEATDDFSGITTESSEIQVNGTNPGDDLSSTTLTVGSATTLSNTTTTVPLRLATVPDGLSGFDLTVTVDNATVATVTAANVSADYSLQTATVGPNSTTVTLRGADLNNTTVPREDNVTLGSIVVTGEVQGTTTLSVTVNRIDDDDGDRIEVTTVNGTVQVRALPPVVGDGRPSDVDGDGLYEDVNGNGRIDFNDVVVLFENIDQPVVADNADAYDFNGNGRIDFDDVVALFEEIE